jgi:hypothetical protein
MHRIDLASICLSTIEALLQQNFGNNLMRQMQQQFAPLAGQNQAQTALGSLQNGLNGLNANVLMSAFQAAPSQGQNGQQAPFFDVSKAENILAAALAAANNNVQAGGNQPQQQSQQQLQQNPFAGLEGLDQLRDFNPLQQAGSNQQNSATFQGFAGLGGLQQQLVNATQQQGQNQSQSGQNQQNQGQQQNQTGLLNAAGLGAWNMNSGAFNPATFLAGAGQFGDQANNFQADVFGAPAPTQSNNQAVNLFGSVPFQGAPPPKRRSSSLSSGSLSPIGKQKVVSGASSQGFQGMFPPNLAINEEKATKSSKEKKEKKKRAKTFPEKLMASMMEFADEEAVAWLPDGKSFVIVNPDLFCDEVLSKVFKESKYASFVRKLHRWGFVRLTSGTGTDCFHHPQFQRNRKEMAGKISCAPRAGDKESRPNSGNSKPPSLAGVEKFIKAKVVAAAASAAANAEESLVLKSGEEAIPGTGDLSVDI